MYAKLNLRKSTTVTRAKDPDERWDGDDTVTDWFIPETFTVVQDRYGEEYVPINFTPEKGEEYYLIYAIYSTGNSFGRDEDGQCELIAICPDKREADNNYEILHNATGRSMDFSTKITVNGTEMTVSVPWNGYFERLTELNVQPVFCRGFEK